MISIMHLRELKHMIKPIKYMFKIQIQMCLEENLAAN